MTRINANINPVHLIDQHLIAEYREIIRIPNILNKKGYNDKRLYPNLFTLNTGHVLFFYPKIKFLHERFHKLKLEMNRRKIINNITDEPFIPLVNSICYNNITSNELIDGNQLIVNRILERINTMKRIPTICGKPVNITKYTKMLKLQYF